MAEQHDPLIYDFTIPMRLPTLGKLFRMHFRVRAKLMNKIAWEVRALAVPPPKPFARAAILVERESTQEPDHDNLQASVKGLLDVLQPCSKRHPLGLGFIENDSNACLVDIQVRHVPGKGERTRVVIREVV